MSSPLRRVFAWLGRAGVTFVILLITYVALRLLAPRSWFTTLAGLGGLITGIWLVVRLLRLAMRHAVWRLRNRLIVTYIFIAVVPVLLVVILAALGAWLLSNQLTVYLVTSELDRRIATLQDAAENVGRADQKSRVALADEVRRLNLDRYPGLEAVLGLPSGVQHVPADGAEPQPQSGWNSASGVVVRDNQTFLWAYYKAIDGDVTFSAPLTGDWLADLVPNLGPVRFVRFQMKNGTLGNFNTGSDRGKRTRGSAVTVPPPVSRLDLDLTWFAYVPTLDWASPNQAGPTAIAAVYSRISAVFGAVFNRPADDVESGIVVLIAAVTVLFVIVAIVALVIGVTMTRTITGAVHHLYEGTGKIREGEFGHRIVVSGRDQLGELANSFNQMTENLERLLVVAKEKERLQSEIEIARDVQSQLFPRSVPDAVHSAPESRLPPGPHGLRRLLRLRIDSRNPGRTDHRRRSGQRNFGGSVDGVAAKLAAQPVGRFAGSRRGGGQRRFEL